MKHCESLKLITCFLESCESLRFISCFLKKFWKFEIHIMFFQCIQPIYQFSVTQWSAWWSFVFEKQRKADFYKNSKIKTFYQTIALNILGRLPSCTDDNKLSFSSFRRYSSKLDLPWFEGPTTSIFIILLAICGLNNLFRRCAKSKCGFSNIIDG